MAKYEELYVYSLETCEAMAAAMREEPGSYGIDNGITIDCVGADHISPGSLVKP
jgi:hypothetical protein